jgi:hypothetical protein
MRFAKPLISIRRAGKNEAVAIKIERPKRVGTTCPEPAMIFGMIQRHLNAQLPQFAGLVRMRPIQ